MHICSAESVPGELISSQLTTENSRSNGINARADREFDISISGASKTVGGPYSVLIADAEAIGESTLRVILAESPSAEELLNTEIRSSRNRSRQSANGCGVSPKMIYGG